MASVTAAAVVAKARSYVGVKESPPNSNNVVFNTDYYGGSVSGSAYAWCAVFVWDVFHVLGASELFYGGGKTASCTVLMQYGRAHGLDVDGGYKPGDIVFFNWSGAKSPAEHVGIVESIDADGSLITIEGNTAVGNDSDGGEVMRRSRPLKYAICGYRPAYMSEEETSMNIIKGSTASETAGIKLLQKAVGANQDGEIGPQTITDIKCKLGAIDKPETWSIYGMPVIIAKDIVIAANPGAGLSTYTNSMTGGFNDGKVPCSILVRDGQTVHEDACHAYQGYPESVIYRQKNGAFGIARVKSRSELPADLAWALGGMGLLGNYNPDAEGFKKIETQDFSDVLRDTNHAVLGVKNGYIYLCFCESMTAAQVNAFAQTLGLEMAVMGDGGGIAGINGGESFAKVNTGTIQIYMVQGI